MDSTGSVKKPSVLDQVIGFGENAETYVTPAQTFADAGRRVNGLARELLPGVSELAKDGTLNKVVQGFRFIYVLAFPLIIIDLIKNSKNVHDARKKLDKPEKPMPVAIGNDDGTYKFAKNKYDQGEGKFKARQLAKKEEREKIILDSSFGIVGNIADLADNISTVAYGVIEYAPTIAETTSNWAGPLGAVAVAFSAVGLVLKGIGFRRIYKLDQSMKGKTEEQKWSELKDQAMVKGKLERILDLKDRKHLITLMHSLETANSQEEDVGYSKKDILDSIEYLRRQKIATMTVGAIAHIVSIVGVGILFFTDMNDIGFALLVTSSSIGIGIFVYKHVTILDSSKKHLKFHDEKLWKKETQFDLKDYR